MFNVFSFSISPIIISHLSSLVIFHFSTNFARGIGAFVNLISVNRVFSVSSCMYNVSFQINFLVYMFAVLFFLLVCIPAGVMLAKFVRRSDVQSLNYLNELEWTFLANFLQMFYPSICAKVFSIFNCIEVPSLPAGDNVRLRYAYDVRCWSSIDGHWFFVAWAVFFLVIYVLAFPAGLFAILYRNRHVLQEYKEAGDKSFVHLISNFYDQYEPEYYWFECLVILRKLLLTGLVALVAPGTPFQVALALLICVSYTCLVLKTTPFAEDSDDVISFVTEVQLSITMFCGFALSMDTLDNPLFRTEAMDVFLVAINCCGFIVLVFINIHSKQEDIKRVVTKVAKRRNSLVGLQGFRTQILKNKNDDDRQKEEENGHSEEENIEKKEKKEKKENEKNFVLDELRAPGQTPLVKVVPMRDESRIEIVPLSESFEFPKRISPSC